MVNDKINITFNQLPSYSTTKQNMVVIINKINMIIQKLFYFNLIQIFPLAPELLSERNLGTTDLFDL